LPDFDQHGAFANVPIFTLAGYFAGFIANHLNAPENNIINIQAKIFSDPFHPHWSSVDFI